MGLPFEEVRQTRRRALFLVGGVGALLLAATMVLSWYVVLRITKPVNELIAATDRISSGELESGLLPNAPAELGTLMSRFNEMARSLRDTREKLVHSAKLSSVGQLVAGISHELNNPLSGMLGQAEHLVTKFPAGDPNRGKLDMIVSEGQRMRRILAELRGMTRPNATERVRVDLALLVRDVVALMKHNMEKAGLTCEMAFPDRPIAVAGVPDRLHQVFLNIFLNAIESMQSGGVIKVSAKESVIKGVKYMDIEVADTGTGIPGDAMSKVTEPFFTTKSGRMGLGLSISREIIEQHGGILRLSSNPGSGTRVTVSLPEASA